MEVVTVTLPRSDVLFILDLLAKVVDMRVSGDTSENAFSYAMRSRADDIVSRLLKEVNHATA